MYTFRLLVIQNMPDAEEAIVQMFLSDNLLTYETRTVSSASRSGRSFSFFFPLSFFYFFFFLMQLHSFFTPRPLGPEPCCFSLHGILCPPHLLNNSMERGDVSSAIITAWGWQAPPSRARRHRALCERSIGGCSWREVTKWGCVGYPV